MIMKCQSCGFVRFSGKKFKEIKGSFHVDKKKGTLNYTDKLYLYACPHCFTVKVREEDLKED